MKFFAPKLILLLLALDVGSHAAETGTTNAPNPVTARDFYNAGTKLLAAKKFADAEKMFRSALDTQDERVQPATMFNLGHTRFEDGAEILKKGPDAQKVSAQGSDALASGAGALRSTEAALADPQLEKLLSSYLEGRGAQRELRSAQKAVKSAMEIFGRTLQRWQRAADDFHGAAELNPADTNATRNAKIVEQRIAELVDLVRRLQELADQLAGQRQQLGKQLSKIKGMIPAPYAPPGGSGEDDEDDNGVKPDELTGQKENAGREGDQMQIPLAPEQAGQMLDGLMIDSTRRLPMGDKKTEKPKDKQGRNW
jgi:hypothetical protein